MPQSGLKKALKSRVRPWAFMCLWCEPGWSLRLGLRHPRYREVDWGLSLSHTAQGQNTHRGCSAVLAVNQPVGLQGPQGGDDLSCSVVLTATKNSSMELTVI